VRGRQVPRVSMGGAGLYPRRRPKTKPSEWLRARAVPADTDRTAPLPLGAPMDTRTIAILALVIAVILVLVVFVI